ncbi:MAG: hypothetical protein ABI726_01785 [bacterium]
MTPRLMAPSGKDTGDDVDRIERECRELVARASEAGVQLRVVGGLAVRMHCADNPYNQEREYGDVDLVTDSKLPDIDRAFQGAGYEPFTRFNALHGHSRAIYYGEGDGLKVDVFIRSFSMCHELPVTERLDADEPTVPLAELLLTKLQIVRLNEKDVRDLCALLIEHQVGFGDDETINADRFASICSCDWGLYHTVELNLGRLEEEAARLEMPSADRQVMRERVNQLLERMASHDKSRKWKMRARVGERVQWYEEPDEVVDAH